MPARRSLSLFTLAVFASSIVAAPVAVESQVSKTPDEACAPRMHHLAPRAEAPITTTVPRTRAVDFTRTPPFDGGGDADIYRREGEDRVYRVPRDQNVELDGLYREMELVLGDMMPRYHGPQRVVPYPFRGERGFKKAYVFDYVGGKFVAPDPVNLAKTPTAIRKKVAESLRTLRDRLAHAGYYPGDMEIENYTFNPETGQVRIFPDAGIFLPLRSSDIDIHKRIFERELTRWNTRNASDN